MKKLIYKYWINYTKIPDETEIMMKFSESKRTIPQILAVSLYIFVIACKISL